MQIEYLCRLFRWSLLLSLLATQTAFAASTEVAPDAALVAAGRQIYERGILPSGHLLEAQRTGGLVIKGEEARCTLCHQRSGMGVAEGAIPVPPVIAPALFGKNEKPPGPAPRRAAGMEFKDYAFRTRPPYDDTSLARAIREGVSISGYQFNYMMPRYELAEPDMKALTAYLHSLSLAQSPGVDASTIHFATVIAAGVDSAERDATVGVLQACFNIHSPDPAAQSQEITGGTKLRPWKLHVWELAGAPDTWKKQLDEKYASQAVFAMVSGLGASEWTPVEQFCESTQLPCLFPNVEVPGSASGGQFSFYFSKGVLLEAEAIARYLRDQREKLGITRVVQVSRSEGSGAKAATKLRNALVGSDLAVEDRVFGSAAVLDGISNQDAVMLWLSENDLSELTKQGVAPPASGALLLSGILGGLEKTPLSKDWKKSALMIYPFDPPARWTYRMAYNLRPWLAQHNVPKADERLQGNTLAACNLLVDGMAKLRYRYLRDYLVELTENYPLMGNAPAPQAYSRFSLGPGQRFSSKGVYIARFATPEFERLEKVEEWIVP